MGRPALSPPPITYQDWLAAGCQPELHMSTMQLGAWVTPTLSKMRVNTLCNEGQLVRENSKIHTHHPTNLAWLKSRIGAGEPPRVGGRPPRTGGIARRHTAAPTMILPPSGEGSQLDLELILHTIYERCDVSALSNADVQKVQRLESAEKIRVERMAKRGQLIDRAVIATVFAKLWQIDSNQLKTLGAKLAPKIAGKFGIEDAGSILGIERVMDEEIARILSHIKRLLDDALVGMGEGAIDAQ